LVQAKQYCTMVKEKTFRKNVRLTDSQIKSLQELSAFDGLDPVEHVKKAIDDYLKSRKPAVKIPQETDISAKIQERLDDPDILRAVWVSGTAGKYEFSALILSESKTGIDKGRISKLSIWDPKVKKETNNFIGSCIVNYDRGWDIKPSKIAEPYYNKVKFVIDEYISQLNTKKS